MIPPPTMSSLRSTGQIEQDADAVLLMFREDQKAEDAVEKIRKEVHL